MDQARRLLDDISDLEIRLRNCPPSPGSSLFMSSKKKGGHSTNKENVNRRETIDCGILEDLLNTSTASSTFESPKPTESRRITRSASKTQAVTPESAPRSASKGRKAILSDSKRRLTADPADLEDLINQLDESTDASQFTGRESVELPPTPSETYFSEANERRQTVDCADLQNLLGDMDSSNSSVTRDSIAECSIENSDIDVMAVDERRQTVDCSDLQKLLLEVDQSNESHTKESINSIAVSSMNESVDIDVMDTNERRQTVDCADLQDLLMEVDESQNVSATKGSLLSDISQLSSDDRRKTVDGSFLDNLLNASGESAVVGRESIESVDLIVFDASTDSTTKDVVTHAQTDSVDEMQKAMDTSYDGNATATINMSMFNDSVVSEVSSSSRKKKRSSTSRSPLRRQKAYTPTEPMPSKAPAAPVDAVIASQSPVKEAYSPVRSKPRTDAPKSALKSAAKPPLSVKKTVVFGSPKVSEFNKTSPTTSLTPMSRSQAKSLYSMSGSRSKQCDTVPENEETAENSRILDEWDRLSVSESGSPESEMGDCASVPNSNSSKKSKRRLSKVFNISREDLDQPEFSEPSPLCQDVSNTVDLPCNLADLVAANIGLESATKSSYYRPSISINDVSTASCTQTLETSLQAMMYAVGGDYLSGNVRDMSSVSSDNSALHYSTTSASVSTHSLGTLIGQDKTSESNVETTPISKSGSPSLSINSDFAYRPSVIPMRASTEQSMLDSSITIELEGGLGDLVMELDNKLASAPVAVAAATTAEESDFNNSLFSVQSQDDKTCRLEGNLADLLGSVQASQDTSVASNMDVELEPEQDEIDCVDESEEIDADSALDLKSKSVIQSMANRSYLYEDLSQPVHIRQGVSHIPTVASTQLDPISMPVAMTTSNVNGKEVLRQLRSLNADARRNSLMQCSTPLASASDMSLGMKRHSMGVMMSAKKAPLPKMSRLSVAPGDEQRRASIARPIEIAAVPKQISIVEAPTMPAAAPMVKPIESGPVMTAESSTLPTLSAEISDLYKRINEAKMRLSTKSVQLDNVAAQRSELLRIRSEQIAALASVALPLPTEATAASSSAEAIAELVQKCKQHKMMLKESSQIAELLNRLTYCKVSCYTSSVVVINFTLSNKATAVMKIALTQSDDSCVLGDIHLDLVNNSLIGAEDREWLLSREYFAQVLANNELGGPLSSASLQHITSMSQLPNLLHKVNGYIFPLRTLLYKLKSQFFSNRLNWSVLPSSNVQIESIEYNCIMAAPIRLLIAGNIEPLKDTKFFRFRETTNSITVDQFKALVQKALMPI